MALPKDGVRTRPNWLRRRIPELTIDPDERALGGVSGGLLWLVGGLLLACYPLLPGTQPGHLAWTYGLAAAGAIWGAVALRINWRNTNPLVTHLSTVGALAGIGAAVSATGGAHSAAWVFLFWVALFGCYFYVRPVAIFYVAACIVIQALPLIYDAQTRHGDFVAQLITASVGYVTIGGSVMLGKQAVMRLRMRAETLAAEQGALHRAATAVIRGESPSCVFEIISRELAQVLGGAFVAVFQHSGRREITNVGNWSDGTTDRYEIGTVVELSPASAVTEAMETRRVVWREELPSGSVAKSLGCRSTIVAPVIIRDQVWGALALASTEVYAFNKDHEHYLEVFGDLVGHIVQSLEERARLAAEALTDQLTGLSNHRALHQRLQAATAAADRSGRVLAVAMLDVDNFKEINDIGGHDKGDEALKLVAGCLSSVVRAGDTIGRLGGDEFMWIMPDTDSHQALMAVERVRDLIAATPMTPKRATTSAGICDTESTCDPAELVRRADMALYSSKASGRNQARVYDAEASISSDTRARWFERSQALVGLRALARAIDAKDPATSEHSERVATFAGRLAGAIGWSTDQVARLREAALVHDVGKLAVPDALLTKPGRLTKEEFQQMAGHAELSARIVGSILSDEQVSWIRSHHERPDGRGYPEGLAGEEIPEGAALIALADAWDVMVAGRPYSQPKTTQEAFEECVALSGQQFTATAVEALVALRESDWLRGTEAAEPFEFTVATAERAPQL